jgi:hypothetical protein
VAEDGSSIQVWSVMAVGDVIIALQHIGPQRPQQGFLDDLEHKILIRVDPADFAPSGLDATTPTGPDGGGIDGTDPTVLDGGAADETEAIPDQGVEEPVPD